MAKLYQYDDLKKTNQALGSFKRNGVPVKEVKFVVIDDKIQFFIIAEPPYTSKPEDEKEPKKKAEKETKVEKKVKKEEPEKPKAEKVKVKEKKVEKKVEKK